MRVLLCGGGTAGHVMPAIAIGEIIEKGISGSTVAFGGRENGDENKEYLKNGHKLFTIKIQGLQRSLSINNIKSLVKVLKSGRAARLIISEYKPDLIIGTGGYVCYPFIRQGQKKGIKTMIHESNVSPGLVTRLLSRKCDMTMLNLEGTNNYLKRGTRTVVVGNPTRSSLGKIDREYARRSLGIKTDELLIVSFGGSLGSKCLNEVICDMLNKTTVDEGPIRYVHATGRYHYNEIKSKYRNLFSGSKSISVVPYIENMPILLTAADIAITRSGAMTVSELCRSGTPSILIPSPNVTANHQYLNAMYMQSAGASIVLEEKDLDTKKLKDTISLLADHPKKRKLMSKKALRLNALNTEELIIDAIRDVMQC